MGHRLGIPLNYGLCEGGPWNAKRLAHHEPSMLVAIDRTVPTKPTALVGLIFGHNPPGASIHWGAYWFDDGTGLWKWAAQAATSIRSADENPVHNET